MSVPRYVLGLSAYYHDSAACLLRNGVIVAAAQEERFTRRKHDASFPSRAVAYCLSEAEIDATSLECVAFYDKPWLKFERLLTTYLAFAPQGLRSFLMAMPQWVKDKLWTHDHIRRELNGYSGPLHFPEHHQSHAASAYYPSPFDRAAIVTIDGVGEWATASWGTGHANQIRLVEELRFPHSLGLLYSAFTYYTGFRVNSGEYKLMGLAPYGKPAYVRTILDTLMDLRDDGSFRLDMRYFNYCQGLTMTSAAFHDLFGGPPRSPESPITDRDCDLARSIQDVTEEVVLRMVRHARERTGERLLCLAGGVALNCVANGRVLREAGFDDVWVQPAAGDAGGALGAAMYSWHAVLNEPRAPASGCDRQHGSYLGPAYASTSIAAWLDASGAPYRRLDADSVAGEAARLIADGRIVGWFSGRMEFGPRALGSRSILGDARSRATQSTMNLKIKRRESFRPFAPACLEEDVAEYFEHDRPSPYMMMVAPVQARRRLEAAADGVKGVARVNQARSDIPAVTHIDYSARLQTVGTREHPAFRRLIEAFKTQTGCGVIVNTSFNVRGEPIVCTPEDAYRCFMTTEMDALVLEDLLLLKSEQPHGRYSVPPAEELID